MRKIPGLNDLRIFEAAGRLQNFRLAGQALSLTHSAVSHRIRSLEDQLGVVLFERQNGVRLTDAGRELHAAVSNSLEQLGVAIDRVTQHHSAPRNIVRLSVLPAFAMHWLLPRLHDFYRRHPEISLQILASVELSEVGAQGVDLALRFGKGDWGKLAALRLLTEYYYPVAAPDLIQRMPAKTPDDLLSLPLLLHPDTVGAGASWARFFKALGITANSTLHSICFDDPNLVLQATEHGHGIAFERHTHVYASIERGSLQRLFDCGLHSQSSYYLVSEEAENTTPAVTQVIAWLIEQAQAFEADSEVELRKITWLNEL